MIDINMTLLAQILNFAILVLLLRWLCYKPIVNMLNARSKRIADTIQRADDDEAKAKALLKEYQAKLVEANEKAQEIQARAEKSAQEYREKCKLEAEKEIARMKANAKEEIVRERAQAAAQIKKQVVALSLLAAGKIVENSMNKAENERLVNSFVMQLDKSKIGELTC